MEAKQASKQPMDQRRNQTENLKKKTTLKHNFQNVWDAAKAVLRWKFIVIQVYLKKKEKF